MHVENEVIHTDQQIWIIFLKALGKFFLQSNLLYN